jgi:superfamily II DNA or RNA helicase
MLKFIHNNVSCYVESDDTSEDRAMIADLSHCLSYAPKGAAHIKSKDGEEVVRKYRTFSMLYQHEKFTVFSAGLMDFVLHSKHKRHKLNADGTLSNEFENYEIHVDEIIDQRIHPELEIHPVSLWNNEEQKSIVLHDYQEEALAAFVTHRRGIIRISMGSGKTIVGMAITQMLQVKTLFLVGTKDLLIDTIAEFKLKANIDAGQIGDDVWNPQEVTVSTIQTLSRRIKEKYVRDYLGRVILVIFDEAQHASRMYQEIGRALKAAYYRVGLSATVGLGQKEEKLKSMSLTGPMIYDVKMKRLVDKKQLAKPTAIFLRIPRMDTDPHWDLMEYDEQYDKGIVHNAFRNMVFAHVCMEMRRRGFASLLLIEKLAHGENIMALLDEHARKWKVDYVTGKHDSKVRTKVKSGLQTGDVDILVTSRIFNEGVNIPSLESVVVASGYKAPGLTYQRYGRGVRKTAIKDTTTIVDAFDEFAPKLREHSEARLALVKKNKAFDVMLVDWQDFEKALDELYIKRQGGQDDSNNNNAVSKRKGSTKKRHKNT